MYRLFKSEKVSIGLPKPLKIQNKTPLLNSIKKSKEESEKESNFDYDNLIKDAHQMYANIIEDANNEAKRIIEESYETIEKLKKQEIKNAYEYGFGKGYEEARSETKAIIEEAKNIRDSLESRKNYLLKEAEDEVVQIILNISRKVIGDELQQNRDIIISQIKLALEKCTYKNKVTIKVSSEDYPNVLVNKGVIESLVEGISEIEIIEDKFLSKGDCIVDTPAGEVNSSIELQLKQLEDAFDFALRNEW